MTYIFIVNDLTHCATLLGNIWKKLKYWYIKLYLPECIVNRMYCYKMEVSHTILIIKNGLGSGRLLGHYTPLIFHQIEFLIELIIIGYYIKYCALHCL